MKRSDSPLYSNICLFFLVLCQVLIGSSVRAEPGAHLEETSTIAQEAAPRPPHDLTNLNAFSLDMYKKVAHEQKGNLAVSPLGSYVLLAFLQAGAGPETQVEIAKVLRSPQQSLPKLKPLFTSLNALPSLSVAQKIYLDETADLLPSYLNRVAPYVAEPAEKVSFSREVKKAQETINAWVEAQTRGLIKNFLQNLNSNTVAVLVSVLHFKGQWKTEFDPKDTAPSEFSLSDGTTVRVPMMRRRRATIAAKQVAGAWAVVLPYKDSTEMLLLLPGKGQDPDSLADLKVLRQVPVGLGAYREPVNLGLPRFEFEVPTFELTKTWTEMGLRKTVNQPDLSNMLSDSSGLELVIFHKTYVKVNEEGTEAAAATAVVVTRSSSGPAPVEILFDRPFLFVLRHSQSGAVFMIGRVEKPEIL